MNGRQSGINGNGVDDSMIVNNLLYNNHASGISLYAIGGTHGSSNNGGGKLKAGSTAINTRTALTAVPADILGIKRPQGTAYDIGAYEA